MKISLDFLKKMRKILWYIGITLFIICVIIIGVGILETLRVNSYFETQHPSVIIFYIVFFSTLSLILFVWVRTALIKKKTITVEEFREKLESKGYMVSDITEEVSDSEDITKVLYATNNKTALQLYILKDEQIAKELYIHKKIMIENKNKNIKQKTNKKTGKHYRFSVLTDSNYAVVSMIYNTSIYVETSSLAEKEARELLKELGY